MEKLSLRKNLTGDLLERWPKDAEGEPEDGDGLHPGGGKDLPCRAYNPDYPRRK